MWFEEEEEEEEEMMICNSKRARRGAEITGLLAVGF